MEMNCEIFLKRTRLWEKDETKQIMTFAEKQSHFSPLTTCKTEKLDIWSCCSLTCQIICKLYSRLMWAKTFSQLNIIWIMYHPAAHWTVETFTYSCQWATFWLSTYSYLLPMVPMFWVVIHIKRLIGFNRSIKRWNHHNNERRRYNNKT